MRMAENLQMLSGERISVHHDRLLIGNRARNVIGIECSGHLRPALDRLGGLELAAQHSAADYDALLAQLKEEVAAEKERRARHEARWAEILDLPQLFIAA